MKGYIAINELNPYIPKCTYIHITSKEANDIKICDKYTQYIPNKYIKNYLIIVSYEHGILTGSNQTGDTLESLKLNIREVDETLHWQRFEIVLLGYRYNMPTYQFRLLED